MNINFMKEVRLGMYCSQILNLALNPRTRPGSVDIRLVDQLAIERGTQWCRSRGLIVIGDSCYAPEECKPSRTTDPLPLLLAGVCH